MKFITLKDTHFRFGFKQPQGRTPDFEEQIQAKIDFVIETAKQHNINCLVLSGDTLDNKQPSKYSFYHIRDNIAVFQKLKEQFSTIYDICGNHSLPFSSVEYKKDSIQQYLINHGFITDLTLDLYPIADYHIYGIDYTPDHQKLLQQMIETDKSNPDKKLIAVIHEHLVPTDKDRIPFGSCLTYKEVTANLKNHKFIIAGHLHKGYQTQTINNCTIINQWNFTRLARDYYAVSNQHKPQLTIVDLKTNTTETIDIPHIPFSEAFIEKELHEASDLQMNISEFIKKAQEAETGDKLIESMPEHLKDKIEYYLELAEGN